MMKKECTCHMEDGLGMCNFCVSALRDTSFVSPEKESMGTLLRPHFALAEQPVAYIINHHMRCLLVQGELAGGFQKNDYRMCFDNWVSTYGLTAVEEALKLMDRGIDGKKFKKVS